MKKTATLGALAMAGVLAAAPGDDSRLRYVHCSTRAETNLRLAEALEQRLAGQGLTMHPRFVTLRLRIDRAMREAKAALDHGDNAALNEQLTLVNAWVDRLALGIGGE